MYLLKCHICRYGLHLIGSGQNPMTNSLFPEVRARWKFSNPEYYKFEHFLRKLFFGLIDAAAAVGSPDLFSFHVKDCACATFNLK